MIDLVVRDLPGLTIVGESAEYAAPPRLEIVRSGAQVLLQWLDPGRVYALEKQLNVQVQFEGVEVAPIYTNGMATVALDVGPDGGFFRLRRESLSSSD